MTKAPPVGPTVAAPKNTKVVTAGPQTLATFEIAGNPATGEITVKQIPVLGRDGLPKAVPNNLFDQTGKSCSGCEVGNPADFDRVVTATLVLDDAYTPPLWICDAALQVASTQNVVSPAVGVGLADIISGATWDGTPLPDTIAITADPTSFTFTVDEIGDENLMWVIWVNVLGTLSTNPSCPTLEFVLTWTDNDLVDLDLNVFGPNPPCLNRIWGGATQTETACNGEISDYDFCPGLTGYERIYWPVSYYLQNPAIPTGQYEFWVEYWNYCTGGTPPAQYQTVDFTVQVLVNGTVVYTSDVDEVTWDPQVPGESAHDFFDYP